MDPARKRRIRLVVALSAAVVLAGALAYTSFSAVQLGRHAEPAARQRRTRAQTYQLTGKVVDGSIVRSAATASLFRVRDRDGHGVGAGQLHRRGPRPVPRGPRGHRRRAQARRVFVGEKDSLVTKCPSKFTDEQAPAASPS